MVRLAFAYSYAISDVRRCLHDLKWIGHVGGARYARQVALDLGIARDPVLEILLLPGEHLGPIRELAALDDAGALRHAEGCAETEDRALPCRVILDIPVRVVERLPDTVQVRFAVGRARRAILRLLRDRRAWPPEGHTDRERCDDHSANEPLLHDAPRRQLAS